MVSKLGYRRVDSLRKSVAGQCFRSMPNEHPSIGLLGKRVGEWRRKTGFSLPNARGGFVPTCNSSRIQNGLAVTALVLFTDAFRSQGIDDSLSR